jgi:hypothetical protein
MSLDTARLEMVRELPGGILQARCPACAEGGHDRTGEHLRIYPDGRYGCCVHPKDKEHRKQIFALAGDRKPGTFTVRLKAPAATPAVRSVKAALASPAIKPPETESENGVRDVRTLADSNSRTPRTGNFESRARAREDSTAHIDMGGDFQQQLKDSESGVRDVRSVPAGVAAGERLPFLTADGTLSIPFDSLERYHWWKGGQSIAETLAEVRAGLAIKRG